MFVTVVTLLPMMMFGQTYSNLWNQEQQASEKDLPKSQMTILKKIADKADRERAYGQLLKARLKQASLQVSIAPDSMKPAVERLQQQERSTSDKVLRAVYSAVLYRIFSMDARQLGQRFDDNEIAALRKEYAAKALAEPEALASVRAVGYEPFVVKGVSSEIFGHDLLSVIGYEVGNYRLLADYYSAANMRAAACVTTLEALRKEHRHRAEKIGESAYLRSLDSLIALYGDLPEACEVAIERYDAMSACTDVTPRQQAAYIRSALERWGTVTPRSNELRNHEQRLTNAQFHLQADRMVALPGRTQQVMLRNLRNIRQLTLKLYRTALKGDTNLRPDHDTDYERLKPSLQFLSEFTQTRRYEGHPDYELFDDSLTIAALPVGVYMIEVSTDPESSVWRSLYYVSDVMRLSQALPGRQVRYAVVSATTGQPLPGAKLRLQMFDRQRSSTTITCDDKGEAVYLYDSQPPRDVWAFTASDEAAPTASSYGTFNNYTYSRRSEFTCIYTDRSIYRPGQTVHVAAIVYENNGGVDNTVVAGKSVKAVLRDANFQQVGEQTVVTDEYGTCHADFILPSGVLTGRFTVQVNNSSNSFRVEEYKRPTFRVEFPVVGQQYKAGDTLTVQASTLSFAGVPVQGARVHYTVSRRVAFWWANRSRFWSYGASDHNAANETLLEADALTDGNGHFSVHVPLQLPAEADARRPMFYHFIVTADVTDQGGETHSGELSLPLGTRTTALSCDLPEKVLRDSLKSFTFTRFNAAGNSIDGKVLYQIDRGRWQTVAAKQNVSLGSLKSGRHALLAVCGSDTLRQEFSVFTLNDKHPCQTTSDWFYVSHAQFPRDGKPVTVQAGSSDANVHVLYTVIAGDKVIDSGTLELSDALDNRKFTYRGDYGNGLLLNYVWVKEGRCYHHSATIRRPLPDKQLRLKWNTFRDRLAPGQQEEWSLSVVGPDGRPAAAQLAATLYDASLDQLLAHQWSLSPYLWVPLPSSHWQYSQWGSLVGGGARGWKMLETILPSYSHFDTSVFPSLRFSRNVMYNLKTGAVRVRGTAPLAASSMETTALYAKNASIELDSEQAAADALPQTEAKPMAEERREVSQPLRVHLSETAFFFPALLTDTAGQVTLRFTLPESLTTWRMMGVAHTKDMCFGMIDGEAVAQKDVMIQPNMPRFVRVGDEALLSARIVNTSKATVSGTASMLLTDAENGAEVLRLSKPFSLPAGETMAVSFPFQPADSTSLLVCRVTASGATFSDGEQHYLPVLPNRECVTVSRPFTQNVPGTKTIDIAALFPADTRQQRLTVEYTNNPAWMMVQALPSISARCDENVIDQTVVYYANTIAQSVIGQSPRIATVFEQWKREQGSETSLMSSLQKDTELKNLTLAETPWVGDALRETDQKERLADFFDASTIRHRLFSARNKLEQLQNGDGSWSWWPGMPGSLYITAGVSEMLVRLEQVTAQPTDARPLLDRALKFIDAKMVEMVEEMKRQQRKGIKPSFPGRVALQWLYVNALDGRRPTGDAAMAHAYLMSLLKKEIKNQSIYEKAMTAIIFQATGDKQRSRDYVESLKEYSVYTDEMGRYYDTPRAGYSWMDYRIPTEVMAIEAIRRVTPDDRTTVDEMRRWLLQEKRTQAWDTPINSVNAVYAFLNGNTRLLDHRESTVLAIDSQPLAVPQATAGLGYVKATVSQPTGQMFTATKTSEGTSWGAVYAQFLQKTAEVEASHSGIKVTRQLLADGPLKVGSRVRVRIVVESERDLDFVQFIDRRAACMEPVGQLSGYRNGYYCSPKDCSTNYYFDRLSKGRHVVETEYFIDRAGRYETGLCTVQCAYAPEYRATAPSQTINVEP